MDLTVISPRKSLNKAFLKVKPNRMEIERFKKNLVNLLDRINESESEEFHKNIVSEFLKNTYSTPNHYINTKERTDLVIHNGKDAGSSVGVLIETKKPSNKNEMLRKDNINLKAFHELLLYYLRERITGKNLEIKYLIATNVTEWFIFDAKLFEKLFAENSKFVRQFNDYESGKLTSTKTDFFYKEIAEPFISNINSEITFTWFDLLEYEKLLRNNDPQDDKKLIPLYKLISPEHLLTLPFANDSNSLDKAFYSELLHIIGLAETKKGGKKLIERKKESERNTGSLIENAIIQLDSRDKISRLAKPAQYGETNEERLLNVALELAITWINRILFLKLLEAQLINYHKGDQAFAFLNCDRVKNYDDLDGLFFRVLARKTGERDAEMAKLFDKVPYLNSSLFEPTELEQVTIFISNLQDDCQLPVISSTVLKDINGKRRKGELNALEYLFEFLDDYDFSSEGSEEIQEGKKNLINASVLGLIFEKINGYKDGSFFTPGFITMYMCRETIRRAVVQKFNDTYYFRKFKSSSPEKGSYPQNIYYKSSSPDKGRWHEVPEGLNPEKVKRPKYGGAKNSSQTEELRYNTLDDIYNAINTDFTKQEANNIINSLKICDPAVGSGHFLVSALNEIIAIKSELKILLDRQGLTLRDYSVEVVNDELIITDDDGLLFEYKPKNRESQRVQDSLFHEKQTIIENCLFGVDINPNSVKICRLRLWIELLKNAYYKIPSSSPDKGRWHEVPEGLTPDKGICPQGNISKNSYPEKCSYSQNIYYKSSSPGKGRWHEVPEGLTPDKGKCPQDGEINNYSHDARIMNLPELKTFRKRLRRNLTPAEAALWKMLQGKKLEGRKFRRQHSVDKYILDFYCPSENLAVELDGEGHVNYSAEEYDMERTLFLNTFGIRVLRFENRSVFEEPEGVLEMIRREFGKEPPRSAVTRDSGIETQPPRPAVTHASGVETQPPRPAVTPPFQGGELLELETLPNIDINIKCGNSLISRYALDADVKKALAKSKWSIDSYRLAVMTYRNAESKEQKRAMERLIDDIKSDFESEVAANDKRLLRKNRLEGELFNITNQVNLFEQSKKEKAEWDKKVKIFTNEIQKLENELEEIKSNKIYDNAFEWRFEFPEVLNDDGDFVGFDVVIGNPPYGRYLNLDNSVKTYLSTNNIHDSTGDIAAFFIKRILKNIIKPNGYLSFIVPKGLTYVRSWDQIRSLFLEKYDMKVIIDTSKAFDEALYEMVIFLLNISDKQTDQIITGYIDKSSKELFVADKSIYNKNIFYLGFPISFLPILKKVQNKCEPVSKYVEYWYGKGGCTPKINFIKKGIPVLTGKEINKYFFNQIRNKWYIKEVYLSDVDIYRTHMKKLVVQDIVAHILNPVPHIKITANIESGNQFCLNTVMCFAENNNNLKNEFLLGILNSKFISFYYYYFIFNQAIRTMHFMPGYADILPITC